MPNSFGQETKRISNTNEFKKEWWSPITQKHKIDLNQYNYGATFTLINGDNKTISHWLELGNCDTIKDQYLKFKKALIIVLFDSTQIKVADHNYSIQNISGLMHDLVRNTIDIDYCRLKWYDIKNKETIPIDSMEGSCSYNFNSGIKIAPS
jgi:hypothetical protein